MYGYIVFSFALIILCVVLWFGGMWAYQYFGRGDPDGLSGFDGETHLPGYRYCGPGTAYGERRRRGDRPINQIDQCCMEHDRRYGTHETTRHADDGLLQCVDRAETNTWQESIDRGIVIRGIGAKERLEDAGIMRVEAFSGHQ